MIVDIKNLLLENSKYIISFLLLLLTYLLLGSESIYYLMYPAGILIGYHTSKLSKFIPFITIETMTASSIFVGMMFGSVKGVIYGIIISITCYGWAGWLKTSTIVNSFIISSGGIYAGVLILFLNPTWTFVFSLILRSLTGVFIFYSIVGGIDLDAISHAIFDPLWNIFIYMPIFVFIYTIIV